MFWIELLAEHVGWLVTVSLLAVLLTLVLMPVLITYIPADYFCHHHRLPTSARHPLVGFAAAAAKNLLGAVFVLAGILLLFMPGQGLILILVGILIMNYPGKYALERWFIQRRRVLPALNSLRARHGKPPLLPP